MSLLTLDMPDRAPVAGRVPEQDRERGGALMAPLLKIWRRRVLFATIFVAILGLAVVTLL